MTRSAFLASSAAALFALGVATQAVAGEGVVKCGGVNSCKGTSACKTAASSCKGQNTCKGMGWSEVSTRDECTSKGGTVI